LTDWRKGSYTVLLFVYPYIAFFVLLQAPAKQAGIPLTDDCSESASILAYLPAGAPVEVRSAIAGYAAPCYAVTAVVGGQSTRGYVQGKGLDAVREFERQREAADAAALKAAVAPAPEAASAAPKAPPAPVAKPHYPPFQDFSATDMKRRPVSVHSLKGKVILVCFWSPNHQNASRELLLVNRLYSQFRKQGLDALAVNASGDSPQLRDTLEDYQLGFRNVPSGFEIASRHNIDYETLPRTYVLNENYEVVASGLHGKALEDLVKKLIAEQ
jgi:hypothetical protein